MKTGVVTGWARGSDRQFIDNARLAEESGFDFLGIADSQCVIHELFSTLTLAAHTTESISLGPMVTNFVTRHLAVTASGLATVDDVSDGRIRMGVGSGDSAVHAIGESPVGLDRLEREIRAFKSLCGGQTVQYDESDIEIAWIGEGPESRNIPVHMAAEGPKTQRLAGRIADGVIIGTGLLPEVISSSIERVRDGAEEAGRSPDDVEKWVLARANIGEDRDAVRNELKASVAGVANHSLKYTFEGKHVPDEYREQIRSLQEQYRSQSHGQPEEHNQQLIDELGLTDYLMDRYAVVGTPEDCLEKLQAIENVPGVDGTLMVIGPVTPDGQRRFLTQMGQDVLPALE